MKEMPDFIENNGTKYGIESPHVPSMFAIIGSMNRRALTMMKQIIGKIDSASIFNKLLVGYAIGFSIMFSYLQIVMRGE